LSLAPAGRWCSRLFPVLVVARTWFAPQLLVQWPFPGVLLPPRVGSSALLPGPVVSALRLAGAGRRGTSGSVAGGPPGRGSRVLLLFGCGPAVGRCCLASCVLRSAAQRFAGARGAEGSEPPGPGCGWRLCSRRCLRLLVGARAACSLFGARVWLWPPGIVQVRWSWVCRFGVVLCRVRVGPGRQVACALDPVIVGPVPVRRLSAAMSSFGRALLQRGCVRCGGPGLSRHRLFCTRRCAWPFSLADRRPAPLAFRPFDAFWPVLDVVCVCASFTRFGLADCVFQGMVARVWCGRVACLCAAWPLWCG